MKQYFLATAYFFSWTLSLVPLSGMLNDVMVQLSLPLSFLWFISTGALFTLTTVFAIVSEGRG